MLINVPKLIEVFEANGLTNVWVDNTGRITHENATEPQLLLATQLRDAHNPAELSQQQEIDQARAALSQIRQYLLQQLVKVSPDTPAQQVTAIKAIANGNTYLARIMTNQIGAMNGAFGWSLTNNPTLPATRLQYIVTVEILTGVLPQG